MALRARGVSEGIASIVVDGTPPSMDKTDERIKDDRYAGKFLGNTDKSWKPQSGGDILRKVEERKRAGANIIRLSDTE
ncbi:MAG: hypothetical protein MN733_28455 [Nitrososphaera sp.]|nr:hypothetical protein [Nitrososphaera sp.]